MDIEGRSVLVTGGGRGLGRAVALGLARRGASVAVVARRAADVGEVVDAIVARGGRAVGVVWDVARDGARIAAEAQAALGEVDVVVHAAGALGPVPLRPLLDVAPEELADVLGTNVIGAFALARALVGPMVLRGRGLLVAISSDAAVARYPTWGAYGASKAAFDHLVGTLAGELDGTGVRLLSVDPGEMDTDMHAAAVPDADRSSLALPEAVADRLLDLVLDEARAPSGSRLGV